MLHIPRLYCRQLAPLILRKFRPKPVTIPNIGPFDSSNGFFLCHSYEKLSGEQVSPLHSRHIEAEAPYYHFLCIKFHLKPVAEEPLQDSCSLVYDEGKNASFVEVSRKH